VSDNSPILAGETGFDSVLAFAIPERNARGRIVRLGPLLDTVLSAHDYPAAIRHLLAEALVIAALAGSLLKDQEAQLTIQAQTDGGIVELLVCDYRQGELRGYVRHDAERLAGLGANPSLYALFGKGFLAVTFDLAASKQRYQGIVPIEGDSLAEAFESYFAQSEQVPTLIRIGVRSTKGECVAGGMLIQHLAEGEDGRERLHVRLEHPEWEHVAVMGGSVRHDELVTRDLSLEQIVWRLFHDEGEIRVEQEGALIRGCRCDEAYYRSVLLRFPDAELAEMREDDGLISVDCAFCSRLFKIEI
jgi:molecular chaperone Hsp33